MENTLPKNWVETTLGESLNIEMGQSPNGNSYNLEGIGLPFMQGKTEFGDIFPTIIKYTSQPTKIVESGTILLSVRAPIGPTNISTTKMCIGRGLAGISSEIIPKNFILYYLRLNENNLDNLGTGTTFKAISGNNIREFPFPLPPLAEQERIVAKLDVLFAQHEAMKKALERIPQLLKDFRQQVLTQAVTGKLTEEWRKGKELEEWREDLLINLIEKTLNSDPAKKAPNENISYIDISSINRLNNTIYDVKLIPSENSPSRARQEVMVNDILLSTVRTNLKNIGIVKQNYGVNTYASTGFYVLRTKNILNSNFLFLIVLSENFTIRLSNLQRGASYPAVRSKDVENQKIKYPPLQEQQEIVTRVESLFAKADAIESRYQTLKEKIEALPQALLHKAFKGELVPQLPTDGDAKDLLAEILQLKEATKPKKGKK